MVCASCGSKATSVGRFCPHCGVPFSNPVAPPSPYPQSAYAWPASPIARVAGRIQHNLQTLGGLWIAYGVLRLLTGFVGMFFLRSFARHPFSVHRHYISMFDTGFPWASGILPFVGTVTIVGVTLALFVGFSLLNRKPWGRTLGIVAGILALFTFPVGTALGLYTLWVLAPTQAGFEYDAIADRS